MVDVVQQVNALQRAISRRAIDAGEAKVMTISQIYNTDLEDVWDAVTSPERIPRWFLPISGDLLLGGRYQLTGNAGGTIERCDPPTGFGATWEYGDQVSWIDVRLTGQGPGSTLFTLEHTAVVDDDLWDQFGPGAVGVGWDLGLLGLAIHLSTGADAPTDYGTAWAMTDEGKQFMTLSSAKWCEASTAFGTDAEAARLAAERTTEFYTATPAPAE